MMTQLLGASFILIAMMLWLARNANGSEVALRAIVLAVFLGDTISFIVMLLAQLSIAASPVGWFNVMIYLLLALGFGYFQFVKPDAT
jgi:hypothetical protein